MGSKLRRQRRRLPEVLVLIVPHGSRVLLRWLRAAANHSHLRMHPRLPTANCRGRRRCGAIPASKKAGRGFARLNRADLQTCRHGHFRRAHSPQLRCDWLLRAQKPMGRWGARCKVFAERPLAQRASLSLPNYCHSARMGSRVGNLLKTHAGGNGEPLHASCFQAAAVDTLLAPLPVLLSCACRIPNQVHSWDHAERLHCGKYCRWRAGFHF